MSTKAPESKGRLYVVATPIGNLKDLTLRALEVLKEADLILCEDTRTTRKLLSHYKISGKKLLSFYKDNEKKRLPQVLKYLKEGARVALVSEAGTPGLSDPGAFLVTRVREAGYPIIPVPGPSALTTFLSVSGWDLGRGFLFLGFPPAKKNERLKLLKEIRDYPYPLIFFVPPHRLRSFLKEALDLLGNRTVVIGRELTKTFEEVLSFPLKEALSHFGTCPPRGELVLLIAEAPETGSKASLEEALTKVEAWRAQGLSLKEAVKKVASSLGLSSKELYQQALEKGL